MLFKINDTILFRQYENYGYITDNSMFGYRMLNSEKIMPGERYVSKSGAVMLGALTKKPQEINAIVKKLMSTFYGADEKEIMDDAISFYLQLASEGFLSYGETYEECMKYEKTRPVVENKGTDINTVNDIHNDIKADDFLRSLHIEISSECNEKCVHCYIPGSFKNKIIDSNLFFQILDEARKMNVINITLSGGEPLIHNDILSFLRRCHDKDFSVNVLSNLTLLNDDVLDEMSKNPLLSVQTSLYSMNPDIHDKITGMNGSYKKTVSAINKLILRNIPVQISCPVMKQNYGTYRDVVDWGKSLNIPVAVEYVIFAEYDHTNDNLCNRLSLDEIDAAFQQDLNTIT